MFKKSLTLLRKSQAQIDKKLLELLEKRFKTSIKIGEKKLQNKLKIEDKQVEEKKIKLLQKVKTPNFIDNSFISTIWQEIFKESKRIQKQHLIDQNKEK